MGNLNTNGETLVKELGYALKLKSETLGDTIKTTKTASSLAFVYEKARNAVEFRADHLIRQAAITRILQRRILLNQKDAKMAISLVKELLWARYLPDEEVSLSKIDDIEKIISKYKFALDKNINGYAKWLIELAACEIEELLVPNPISQIVTNFVATNVSERIDFEEKDEVIESIQVYIAVERSFNKNSEILIAYRLLKVFLPEWKKAEDADQKLVTQLYEALSEIDKHLNYPAGNLIKRKVTQMTPPFNVIRDLIEQSTKDFIKNSEDIKILEKKAEEILNTRYHETRNKVMRASKRSIIYIFLTKMIFALLLELPFDAFFGRTNYLSLGINIVFPPSLMFLLNIGIELPSEKNTSLIIRKIKEYLYNKEEIKNVETIKTVSSSSRFEGIFFGIFLATSFAFLFGILWALNLLDFNPVSQIIFLFFLSVVSFFAFRVRDLAKDYMLKEGEGENFLSTIIDYLFLPVIKAGQWLSIQISKINVLSFIFDFIIEAPLKTFLEILENWLHFVRVKKEEFLSGD